MTCVVDSAEAIPASAEQATERLCVKDCNLRVLEQHRDHVLVAMMYWRPASRGLGTYVRETLQVPRGQKHDVNFLIGVLRNGERVTLLPETGGYENLQAALRAELKREKVR